MEFSSTGKRKQPETESAGTITAPSTPISTSPNNNTTTTNGSRHLGLFIGSSPFSFSIRRYDGLVIEDPARSLLVEDEGREDSNTNTWMFPLTKLWSLCGKLRSSGIGFHSLPKFVVKLISQINRDLEQPADVASIRRKYVPANVAEKLAPYQEEAIDFALTNHGRVILADELGMGKTLQALCVAQCFPDSWPLLIICPDVLCFHWKSEILKWFPAINDHDILIVFGEQKEITSFDYRVHIIALEAVSICVDLLHSSPIKFMILDEAQVLATNDSNVVQPLLRIIEAFQHCILLSATQIYKPMELLCQIQALNGALFPSKKEFESRYCKGGNPCNLLELQTLLSNTIYLSRPKSSVMNQLPAKRRQLIYFNVPKEHQESLQHLKETIDSTNDLNPSESPSHGYEMMPQHPSPTANHHLKKKQRTLHHDYFSLTGIAKTQKCIEFLKGLMHSQNKIVVFGHHHNVLEAIAREFNRDMIVCIDGTTPQTERQTAVQQFQQDPNAQMAFISLTAGTSLHLSAATSVVFAELYWTPTLFPHAEDRACPSREHSVNIYYLLGHDTMDDSLWPQIKTKLESTSDTYHSSVRTEKNVASWVWPKKSSSGSSTPSGSPVLTGIPMGALPPSFSIGPAELPSPPPSPYRNHSPVGGQSPLLQNTLLSSMQQYNTFRPLPIDLTLLMSQSVVETPLADSLDQSAIAMQSHAKRSSSPSLMPHPKLSSTSPFTPMDNASNEAMRKLYREDSNGSLKGGGGGSSSSSTCRKPPPSPSRQRGKDTASISSLSESENGEYAAPRPHTSLSAFIASQQWFPSMPDEEESQGGYDSGFGSSDEASSPTKSFERKRRRSSGFDAPWWRFKRK